MVGVAEDALHLRMAVQQQHEAAQPRASRHHRQEGRHHRPQMHPGQLPHDQAALAPAHGSRGRVARRAHGEHQEQDDETEGGRRAQQGQGEDVERQVEVEHRIPGAPGGRLVGQQGLETHGAGDGAPEPEGHQGRDAQDGRRDVRGRELLGDLQVTEAALDADPTEGAGHQAQVHEEDRAHDDAHGGTEPPAPGELAPEHGAVAHLLVPQGLDPEEGDDAARHQQDAEHPHQDEGQAPAPEGAEPPEEGRVRHPAGHGERLPVLRRRRPGRGGSPP